MQGKPAIAHRDIKSKNILVNNEGECVIADFGLAVMYYQNTNSMNIADNPKIGTKRYMAPEMLDETYVNDITTCLVSSWGSCCSNFASVCRMHLKNFEAFKKVDMYAVGLVLWELFRRTGDEKEVEEYKPPFFDVVDSDPSFEQMKAVICDGGIRPQLPSRWQKDPVIYRPLETEIDSTSACLISEFCCRFCRCSFRRSTNVGAQTRGRDRPRCEC